jgi:hypothetical protein
VQDVLWVIEVKMSVILVSMIEKKGFYIMLWNGKILIMPIGYILDKENVFGVRERNLYRLKGQLMREIASNIVTKNRE